MKDVNPDFEKWACSLSGCDGGDPSAKIWLCGIEWGFGKKRGQAAEEYEAQVNQYYVEALKKEIAAGAYQPSDAYSWSDSITYPFGISTAKLFMAIKGFGVENYAHIERECLSSKLESKLFKLNLYPVSFNNTSDELWLTHGLDGLTGLKTKGAYRVWCFLNRFPFISRTVKQHNPQLIIGAGVSYLVDFFVCFAGGGGSGNICSGELNVTESDKPTTRRYYWSKINDGKTLLVVIPFFTGQYGLNSNALITQLGSQLAELLR